LHDRLPGETVIEVDLLQGFRLLQGPQVCQLGMDLGRVGGGQLLLLHELDLTGQLCLLLQSGCLDAALQQLRPPLQQGGLLAEIRRPSHAAHPE